MTVWTSSYEELKPRYDTALLLSFFPFAYVGRLRFKTLLGLVSC